MNKIGLEPQGILKLKRACLTLVNKNKLYIDWSNIKKS